MYVLDCLLQFSLCHRIGCESHNFRCIQMATCVHGNGLRRNHLLIGWILYFLWHTLWHMVRQFEVNQPTQHCMLNFYDVG
jgi:hypothetical protein